MSIFVNIHIFNFEKKNTSIDNLETLFYTTYL